MSTEPESNVEPHPIADPETDCNCVQFRDAQILSDGHDARCIYSYRASALWHTRDSSEPD